MLIHLTIIRPDIVQDPDIELPDFQQALGAALAADLDAFLQNPNSDDAATFLAALPTRLRATSGATAATLVSNAPPPQFSAPLLTHVALRACLHSLQARRSLRVPQDVLLDCLLL